ncbi:MAG: restriction endonuclease subunit S [Archaeoglobaceae archaeon]
MKIEFYKETEFKDTEIGRIPKDWEVVKLGDEKVSTLVKSGSTPLKKIEEYWNGEIPFVTQKDMTKVDHYLYDTSEKITELGLRSSNLLLIPENSILLSMYGTIGKIVINKIPVSISQNIAAIRLNKKNVDEEYLYYALQIYSFQFKRQAKTITLKHLDIKIVKNTLIPLPPLPEQQKIAEILSTVDEAIQKTNEVIAKTERLKRGLMQELLTKGIGHKEFKDTEIGRIPKDWEVVKLSDVAQIRGIKKLSELDKVAFIPMELIPDVEIFVKYEIRDVKDVKSYTYCEAGDLLLSKITPCFENGKQGIVPLNVPNGFALATTEVFPIVCRGIDKLFLFYILKLSKFRKILEFSMRGTTGRQRVPKNSVERLRIPLPPSSEQQKIAEILSTVDKKLEIERKEKAKLERIKQGLTDLLLTGKVRVKLKET